MSQPLSEWTIFQLNQDILKNVEPVIGNPLTYKGVDHFKNYVTEVTLTRINNAVGNMAETLTINTGAKPISAFYENKGN